MLFGNEYKSIVKETSAENRVMGSRFIAFAIPFLKDADLKLFMNEVKSRHPDATHWCYGYVINPDKSGIRFSDSGEPPGTAGRPIVNQILKADLTNVLIVVVRYFGGTMLGIRGLIDAYGTVARDCLSACEIITHSVKDHYLIQCKAGDEHTVFVFCRKIKAEVKCRNEGNVSILELKVPIEESKHLVSFLKSEKDIRYTHKGTY